MLPSLPATQTVRFPAILQQPRAGHFAGNEDTHPHRTVRLPQPRVAEREPSGQRSHQGYAQRRAGKATHHRSGHAQPMGPSMYLRM